MTSMEVFDATVKALTDAGLLIILNNHISDAMWCCSNLDGNGLWHNKNYSADQWLEALKGMTTRYLDQPLVVGNDLRNEIRADVKNLLDPNWGLGGDRVDWKKAATEAANEVL